jgi:hypothetical protein
MAFNAARHLSVAVLVGAALLGACHRAPNTADEVLDRSIAAHGGAALTRWKTLTIRGRIRMQDGIAYQAAYLLLAKTPDKLRVEHDMTKDRGRLFYEYFMNGAAAWSRANLVVGTVSAKQVQRWYVQAMGVAQARTAGASGLSLKPDALVEWPEPAAAPGASRGVDARPAYVLSYRRDGEVFELYVDKDTYYLLQETWPGGRRVYKDFKRFGNVVFPTRVLEITKGRQGEVVTPITFESVSYDEPIEEWLFTEDMPAARAVAGAEK